MAIREDDEARRGTDHGTGGIETYTGDGEYKGDHHGEVLQEEKNDKWHDDVAIAIVEGMYLWERNKRWGLRTGRWMAYRVRSG